MARRTLRDVRCSACDTVEERLLKHDADGNPPASVACKKCGREARVLPVLRVNFGGTLWSQEESRALQVHGEDGLREGKGLRHAGDYERELEKKGVTPAPDNVRRLVYEQAADYKADADRRRHDPEQLRKLADNRIISQNTTMGEASAASAQASVAMARQQFATQTGPMAAMLQNMATSGMNDTSAKPQDWGGHFHDAGDGVQTFKA